MSFLRQALTIGYKHFLAFFGLAVVLIWVSSYSSIGVMENLRGTLLSAKLAVMSLTIATMTFYYRMFWESIEKLKTLNDVGHVVNYHISSFIFLFGGGLFVSLSLAIDMYMLFFNDISYLVPVHMGLMFSGFVLLFIFLLVFLGRTLGEMQSLKSASKSTDPTKDKTT
jgi:hypothetical protein